MDFEATAAEAHRYRSEYHFGQLAVRQRLNVRFLSRWLGFLFLIFAGSFDGVEQDFASVEFALSKQEDSDVILRKVNTEIVN